MAKTSRPMTTLDHATQAFIGLCRAAHSQRIRRRTVEASMTVAKYYCDT